MAAVRTVLGDIPAAELGATDAHDHLFFRSAALPGQELDDPDAALAELAAFHAVGGRAVVQWSPYGTGRRADVLAKISQSSGVHLIAATGLHQAAHYPPALLERIGDGLAELFVAELTEGLRAESNPTALGERIRAGVIKVAGAFHGLDAHARRVMTAAAQAHHATDAPIAVHHEMGTAVLDVLDLLCGELAVPPAKVILGHLNRFPDPGVHREAARSGAYLAFDGPSRTHHATDWRTVSCLAELATAGHLNQLLLGADTTTADARATTGGGPGMPYLLRVLRPRIERELSKDAAEKIFVGNPARAFSADWR